jgi:hypothetical protein
VLSPNHPHRQRVIALLQAASEAIPAGFVPYRTAIDLSVVVSTPTTAPRGDATNFLGGIADVLQRKQASDLGALADIAIYENDLQLRRLQYGQRASSDLGYEVRIRSFDGPDLVAPRSPTGSITDSLIIQLGDIDEVSLEFANAIERPRRRSPVINGALSLLDWLQIHAGLEPNTVARLAALAGGAQGEALYATARQFVAVFGRLLAGSREQADLAFMTGLRRTCAQFEVIDLDGPADLTLARFVIDGTDLTAVLCPLVRSAYRVLLPSVRERIKWCVDPDCGRVFLDRTKNGTKAWCSDTCGNRAKQRAYRERRGLADGAVGYVVT